ncbi:hypothetical protein [Pseudoalteromonas phage PHS21]|nr:hypothetical protein [Pseudoalteromonas phage PHS21]
MNLTNDIILEFKNGYFEIQHKRVSGTSGKGRLSDKKTFATRLHLEKYLAPYSAAQEELTKAIEGAIKERGIKDAKAGIAAKDKFGRKSA